MADAGRVLLILALLSSIYGLGASLYGARTGLVEWVDSGRRAMYVVAGIAATAFVILDVAFISSDFSYNVVASGSSTTTRLGSRPPASHPVSIAPPILPAPASARVPWRV